MMQSGLSSCFNFHMTSMWSHSSWDILVILFHLPSWLTWIRTERLEAITIGEIAGRFSVFVIILTDLIEATAGVSLFLQSLIILQSLIVIDEVITVTV